MQQITKPTQSRGGNSLRSGTEWEQLCAKRLSCLNYHDSPIHVGKIASGTHGQDIPSTINGIVVGWEAKNKGGFEGGGTTLYEQNGKLEVPSKYPLLKSLKGDFAPWNRIPSKGEMVPDDYLDVPSDSIARFYNEKGSHYMIVEGKGIYHTGNDNLNLGVPLFNVKGIRLRFRVTKHMKNGLPTDISMALTFKKKNIPKSSFCLFNRLPPGFTEVVE